MAVEYILAKLVIEALNTGVNSTKAMRLCDADGAATERIKSEHNDFTLMALELIDAIDQKEN